MTEKVRAFCVGGLMGGPPFNFSIGIKDLAEELNKNPLVSATYEENSYFPLAVVAGLIKAGISAARYRHLVFIGHSYGAEAASWIAAALWKIGIKVSLLVVVDTVITQTSIGATGGDRILWFQKVDPMGGGDPPFEPGPGRTVRTQLSMNHVTMALSTQIHSDTISRVNALTVA
jgi:pimeloyl-ACP methyl ester carboxylesterase